ncbi:hypothetical protein LSUB1_G002953 [Lachnellula subtilissima]|uniref:Transcription factor domain-containing protein n=1 Tax=Lachnellula subtilissima TaxID=602034 RepID=A0A8H8RI99_9HELO|nr:hypothetical protein LSUB1_G002953 [Lachnellula subtilissima]
MQNLRVSFVEQRGQPQRQLAYLWVEIRAIMTVIEKEMIANIDNAGKRDNSSLFLLSKTDIERSPGIRSSLAESIPETDPDPWNVLPPFEEVVEGCRTFFTTCFQLGFLPKAIFLERLAVDRKSIGVFFLLSILSVSARFTKCLIDRYGDANKAIDYFIMKASELLPSEIYNPSLERTQAFFLLGVSEWTQGNRTRSALDSHGNCCPKYATLNNYKNVLLISRGQWPESNIFTEKRAIFFPKVQQLQRSLILKLLDVHSGSYRASQDHLYSEHNAAVSFPLTDITALLPSDETDFAYGAIPQQRAALQGIQAALKNPELCSLQSRSPFATLIEAHSHWGEIARRAGRASRNERERADERVKPWERASEYSQVTKTLKEWEEHVPARHRWSLINLRGHKAEFLDLAYLSQTMVVRINNIVIRRIYLEDILESRLGTSSSEYAVPEFWTQMSHELFTNVYNLHEQFDTWFTLRSADEGIPSIVVFGVYICGSLASYLWKWPQLCPQLAEGAEGILNRSLEVLAALMDRLPHVSKWLHALQKIAVPLQARGAIDGHLLQPEKSFAALSTLTQSVEIRQTVPRADQSSTQTTHDSIKTHMPSDRTSSQLNTEFDTHRQAYNNHLHFTPGPIGDDMSRNEYHPRSGEGVGGMSSLDFNSGYSFDEELMRLLQGGM